ncbi:alpha/beta fold hydrolase [Amycolatopsis palatopharyngis]|uniref:alpha/beta fold hydrolase n=1 Tax=Amycolatopsis palatopharyngis TaxID=187982 RepID=UPI000E228389|nr:alpha/beta hydrolase [Amycolatopsis palatopharyngis]
MSGFAVRAHTLSRGVPGAPFVVFAHGMEGHWASWKLLAAHLDPDWRLVALELPWQAGKDYRWRARPVGDWLGDGLDLLGAIPEVLVAHSFGANAALELLCAHDPRPGRAAALMCPFYRLPRYEVSWRMYDRSRETFVKHIGDGVRARLGKRAGGMDPEVLDGMVRVALDRAGPLGFAAVFDCYTASADLPLDQVQVPIRVLVGGEDPTLPPKVADALVDGMPGATLRVHENFDHFFHVRQAAAAAAEVSDLVAEVLATTTKVGELR